MTDTKQLEERREVISDILLGRAIGDADMIKKYSIMPLTHQQAITRMLEVITAAETAARIDELKQIRDKFGVFRDQTLGIPVDTKAVSVKDINRRMDELRLQNQTGGSDERS